jgi:hypothetical protein
MDSDQSPHEVSILSWHTNLREASQEVEWRRDQGGVLFLIHLQFPVEKYVVITIMPALFQTN